MNTDIRLAIGFWSHPKTGRLIRECGLDGVRSLQILWMWAAQHRPDGSLHDMDDLDIEMAADWRGEGGKFFSAIIGKWVDSEGGSYALHEWREHNPWACGAVARSDVGRFSRMKKTHPAIHTLMASKGIESVSKDFYTKIVDGLTLKEIEALLPAEYPDMGSDGKGKPEGKPKEHESTPQEKPKQTLEDAQADLKDTLREPQADLKQTLEDTSKDASSKSQAQSPSPIPLPSPAHESLENPEEGEKPMLQTIAEQPEDCQLTAADNEVQKPKHKKTERVYFPEDSFPYKAAAYLLEAIKKRLPGFKNPNLHEWASHVDAMIRIDERPEDGIRMVLKKLHEPGYWYAKNVLSGRKLREKYDYIMAGIVEEQHRATSPMQTKADQRLARHQQIFDNLMKE